MCLILLKMSRLANIIICVVMSVGLFPGSECQVTITNINGTDNFLCGYITRLECAIPVYIGGMSWKLDGTIIAQCAFGSCTALGVLPPGDTFTPDETNKKFYLDIGITHDDNETMYQCDDGANQDQTTVIIQVRNPCICDCAGPNIYTATDSNTIDNSNTGGNSRYRFKVYHKDFKQYAISSDSSAIYNCGITTTVSTTKEHTTVTSRNTERQVTLTNINGIGNFLCGYSTIFECAIPGYAGGMSWKLDGTIIAQCAFGSCTALGALPPGDTFTPDENNKKFYLDIGITHDDNETMYTCDDGLNQDQTTVIIQVPPSRSAFTMDITEKATSITVEAGCFYPSDAGRMDVYCIRDDDTVEEVYAAESMTPTTTGCIGDCAGPNIYTAIGSITIDSSNTGGNSRYRFKVYHKDFKQYAISSDSSAIYNCGYSTSLPHFATSSNNSAQQGSACGTTFTIIIAVCCVVILLAFI